MNVTKYIDDYFYPDVENNWDDKILREIILSTLKGTDKLLDLGAGAGIISSMNFKKKCAAVYGVDLDPRVMENKFLDYGCIANVSKTPYEDASFDLVIADNLMEHLEFPTSVFKEINRILKPGGFLIFKTPNKNHYMPLIARMTSHSVHRWVNKMRGRNENDTFETKYLCNSSHQVHQLLSSTSLEITKIDFFESRPEYLRFSFFIYFFGIMYEKFVNSLDFFKPLRIVMIVTVKKKL